MENALETKKQRLFKRLENTIDTVNSIFHELNSDLVRIIHSNEDLVRAACAYETWLTKD